MFSKRLNANSYCVWLTFFCPLLPAAAGAAEPVNLAHVPARAVAAMIVHPEGLWQSPRLELLPWEVIQASAQQELGIDPLVIETAIVLSAAPTGDAPPDWGVILRFSQPQTLAGKWLEQTEPATVGQVSYRRAAQPMEPSFCQLDPRTLLVGAEPMLREMIATEHAAGPLRQMLSSMPTENDITAVLAVSPIRDLVKQFIGQRPPLPPRLQPLLEVPDQLDAVMVAVNVSRERISGIKLIATDEAAAQKLETTLSQALALGKQMVLAEMMQEVPSGGEDASEQAMQRYVIRLANMLEARLKPARRGDQLLLTFNADYVTIGVLVALLLPAVQSAREAVRRTQSSNNLKNLAVGMLNHHDTFDCFPAAYNKDAAGKPLLSWRVYLLPFLEQRAMYDQFRKNEPWDSPHNRQFIAQMPEVFRAPGSQAPPGNTNYLGIRGERMTFIAPTQAGWRAAGSRLADFTDSTANTMMIVEASDAMAVEWTRPADYEPDETQPLKGLLGLRPGGFLGVLVDGTVRFISRDIAPEMLLRWFTKADGLPVRLD